MGKGKAKNAFFKYLLKTQRDLKREGKDLSMDSPELMNIADTQWRGMSEEQKRQFKSSGNTRGQSLPITPKPYKENTDVMDDERDQELYYDKMIECSVKACQTKEDLMNASFFIIGTNVMVKTDDRKHIPLEIGISRYTIANGIDGTYHVFVDAGGVPMGYMHSAKQWAEMSHKIPLEHFLVAVNNYQKIVEDIHQFLDGSRMTNEVTKSPTPMMVFCREDAIEQTRGVFEWLANKYKSTVPSFRWDLEVLDIVQLLFYISKSQNQTINQSIGDDLLSSSAFDYSYQTNCDFHEEQDNKNCAQGLSRRLCYMLSTTFGKMFGIALTERHLPPERQNIIVDTYTANLQPINPLPANRYHYNPSQTDDDWEPRQTSATDGAGSSGQPVRATGIGRGRGLRQ